MFHRRMWVMQAYRSFRRFRHVGEMNLNFWVNYSFNYQQLKWRRMTVENLIDQKKKTWKDISVFSFKFPQFKENLFIHHANYELQIRIISLGLFRFVSCFHFLSLSYSPVLQWVVLFYIILSSDCPSLWSTTLEDVKEIRAL